MVAVAGMTARRYYTLDSAPGTVRGQVRAMFEAAHVSAQDGHTWEAHPRDAMHILLEEETRDNNNNNNNNNNNAGTQARATAGSVAGHVARAGWWERMCAALAVDVCGSAAGCEQGRRRSRRGGMDEGHNTGQYYTCRV